MKNTSNEHIYVRKEIVIESDDIYKYVVEARNFWKLESSHEKGLEVFRKLLKKHPDSLQGEYGVGFCLNGLNQYNEAESILANLLHKTKKSKVSKTYKKYYTSKTLNLMGVIYKICGRYKQAYDTFEESRAHNFTNGIALLNCLILSNEFLNKVDEAENHYYTLIGRYDASNLLGYLDDDNIYNISKRNWQLPNNNYFLN